MVMINMFLGCVLPSPHEPDPSFPQCWMYYATERGSGDSGLYTVAQWNSYAMYELTTRLFQTLDII